MFLNFIKKIAIRTMEQSIVSASKLIKGMTKTFNLGTAKVLKAVCAVLTPPSCFSDNVSGVAVNDFCTMIGVNRIQGKYMLGKKTLRSRDNVPVPT